MDKAITNYNDKRQYHGYNEWYNTDNELWHRGNFKNDDEPLQIHSGANLLPPNRMINFLKILNNKVD